MLIVDGSKRVEATPVVENRSLTLKNMQDLVQENEALQQRVNDLTRQCAKAMLDQKSGSELRRAALNLMQDAVEAREAEHRENAERRRVEEELRLSHQRKDEFLATLAHELRNPLAPIRNSLELLRRSGGDDAEAIHEILERQVNHLVRLVDDLLDVSRITHGRLDLRKKPVELRKLIDNALDLSRTLIDGAHHRITVDLPEDSLVLSVDPDRISQVFANLLNNAAKYTPEGGAIWITARQEGGDAVISVRDNGIGIESNDMTCIFDMFTQLAVTSDRIRTGVGIGLALVRAIVKLHGGSVDVRSDGAGKGTEFIVRLPRNIDSSTSPTASKDRSAGALPSRILVVDDNHDAADSLGRLLRFFTPNVWIAYSGEHAIQLIEANHPSLVLLDIGMPGMNGFEVARRVRMLPNGRQIKLVAVTGWGQENDRQQSSAAGFDQHLVKPINVETLQAALALANP